MRRPFLVFWLLCSLIGGATVVRGQSSLDGFDPNPNSLVLAVVLQPDGKIIFAGGFTSVAPSGDLTRTRNRVARVNANGSIDAGFVDPNVNGDVHAIAIQADGKVLIGGSFTSVGGQTRNRIARLNADGTLDTSFDANANNTVRSIVMQADGKILVGGNFTTIGGQTRNRIARLNPATGAADSFNPDANNGVSALVIQPDGKIVVGGGFTTVGGQTRNRIARLDPSSGAADSFNPDANNSVSALALGADGKVLAGGRFTTIGGAARNRMARLDGASGTADAFNPNADLDVFTIVVQGDGKILAGGDFTTLGGKTRSRIARLDPISATADAFDPSASALASVYAIAVQPDESVIVGGNFTTFTPNGGATVTRNYIARLQRDGRVDRTLNLGMPLGSAVIATAIQPDGKILIGGLFNTVLGQSRKNLARLNSDGTLDTAFNPNPDGNIEAITVAPDGKILVGGFFGNIGGQARTAIARLDPVTGLADSFKPTDRPGIVHAIVVQPDGKILIGGDSGKALVRVDPTTGAADSFSPNADGSVVSIAIQADGKIVVGGIFNNIGGQARKNLARLDPATGAADGFDPSPTSTVTSVLVQPDGKILVAGFFTGIGGQFRAYVARLNSDGTADSFNPGSVTGDGVHAMALQADGKVLVGGKFSNIGGQPRARIARLNPADGSADSYNPNPNDGVVYSVALQSDGKVLAGGDFTSMDGQGRAGFARLTNNTIAAQSVSVTQTTATWTRSGSAPQFVRVGFESTTDGVNYTFLGNATAQGSNWKLSGLNFPLGQNAYVRARGYYHGSNNDGSESIAEGGGTAFIATADPTPTPAPTATPASQLLNLSTRKQVGAGSNVLIGGFIVTGTESKKVLLRGLGPSLPVSGALADPTLELHDSTSALLAFNDNWRDASNFNEIAAILPPSDDRESAILTSLTAKAASQGGAGYTGVLAGKGGTTGIGLLEIYDLATGANSKLANISTRGFVGVDPDLLIGGFIPGPSDRTPLKVLLRALGPSLAAQGVSGALSDPALELHDANGATLVTNDNWRQAGNSTEIATILPPTDDREAAILTTVPPANSGYTAVVRGSNGATGVALVEVYALQ